MDSGVIPVGYGIWSWGESVPVLKPGEQVTIAINSAIDNTQTYENSINFADPDIYTFYDPSIAQYTNKTHYPAPAEAIPQSHYMRGYPWGLGNCWVISSISPAFIVFRPEDGVTPEAIKEGTAYNHYYGGTETAANLCKNIKVDWIIDGVETFSDGVAGALKRLTNAVDAGQVTLKKGLGYTPGSTRKKPMLMHRLFRVLP